MTTGFIKAPGARFPVIEMAPNASHVYDLNWADPADPWLDPADQILGAVYTATAGAPDISEVAHTNTTTQVRLSAAGKAPGVYLVTCAITTLLNNPDSRSFEVRVAVR